MTTPIEELLHIPVDSIDFGKRGRQEYKEIKELADSIKDAGLIQPIRVLRKSSNEHELKGVVSNDKPFLLITGGRRLTAYIQEQISPTVPAVVYGQHLNEYEVRNIELLENLQRDNLTWTEESVMEHELHGLQQKIYGKAKTSTGKGHSLQDTADLLNKSKSSVKLSIDLAEALKHIPELGQIKNKSDAIKLMRQMGKSINAEDRAKQANKDLSEHGADGVKKRLMESFVLGSFFEGAQQLESRTFDLIEIDPPYGIDLGEVKKSAKHTTMNYDEIPAEKYRDFMNTTLTQAHRLLKNDGWLVLWYAIDPWHSMMVELLEKVGFKFCEVPALWVKNGGQTNRPQHYFGSAYEPFLYARKTEDARLNGAGKSNYLIHAKVAPDKKMHPTQRPLELMEEVIQRFISKGKILIPFGGSGVTLRAAHNLNMKAITFDTSQDAKNKFDAFIADSDITKKFTL